MLSSFIVNKRLVLCLYPWESTALKRQNNVGKIYGKEVEKMSVFKMFVE